MTRGNALRLLGGFAMLRKIVLVLLLAALAMLVARLAYDAPVIQTRIVMMADESSVPVLAPPLMYAGIRG
jgi:hypothetical protein